MDVIHIAKPHFCTCSTFINICKDGHVLTCKPDAIFFFYFFVATNSTYVSVSVRVYIFFISAEGGAKNKVKDTIPPNFEELIESITNMLFFFQGGLGRKVMRYQS